MSMSWTRSHRSRVLVSCLSSDFRLMIQVLSMCALPRKHTREVVCCSGLMRMYSQSIPRRQEFPTKTVRSGDRRETNSNQALHARRTSFRCIQDKTSRSMWQFAADNVRNEFPSMVQGLIFMPSTTFFRYRCISSCACSYHGHISKKSCGSM